MQKISLENQYVNMLSYSILKRIKHISCKLLKYVSSIILKKQMLCQTILK